MVLLGIKVSDGQHCRVIPVLAHGDLTVAIEVDVWEVAERARAQVRKQIRARTRAAHELRPRGRDPATLERCRIDILIDVQAEAMVLSTIAGVVLHTPSVVSAGVARDGVGKIVCGVGGISLYPSDGGVVSLRAGGAAVVRRSLRCSRVWRASAEWLGWVLVVCIELYFFQTNSASEAVDRLPRGTRIVDEVCRAERGEIAVHYSSADAVGTGIASREVHGSTAPRVLQ